VDQDPTDAAPRTRNRPGPVTDLQIVHVGGGHSCPRCGYGFFEGYDANSSMTVPCNHCGHVMPGEMSENDFLAMIYYRDNFLGGSQEVFDMRKRRVNGPADTTALRDAIANARLEGIEPTEETLALLQRMQAGEITVDDAVAAIVDAYK
jgi:hypothetical protein